MTDRCDIGILGYGDGQSPQSLTEFEKLNVLVRVECVGNGANPDEAYLLNAAWVCSTNKKGLTSPCLGGSGVNARSRPPEKIGWRKNLGSGNPSTGRENTSVRQK